MGGVAASNYGAWLRWTLHSDPFFNLGPALPPMIIFTIIIVYIFTVMNGIIIVIIMNVLR